MLDIGQIWCQNAADIVQDGSLRGIKIVSHKIYVYANFCQQSAVLLCTLKMILLKG